MDAELKRVKKNLRQHVVDFFAEHLHQQFKGTDLAAVVHGAGALRSKLARQSDARIG